MNQLDNLYNAFCAVKYHEDCDVSVSLYKHPTRDTLRLLIQEWEGTCYKTIIVIEVDVPVNSVSNKAARDFRDKIMRHHYERTDNES